MKWDAQAGPDSDLERGDLGKGAGAVWEKEEIWEAEKETLGGAALGRTLRKSLDE